jgi:hypothetical protein
MGVDDRGPDSTTAPPADARLRAVQGPLGSSEPRPAVRLRREFKGLTVADLLRDEILERLPGQVRSALHHIERGDHAAAERALPGEFTRVLPGPWQRRRGRQSLAVVLALAALLAAAAAVLWSFG